MHITALEQYDVSYTKSTWCDLLCSVLQCHLRVDHMISFSMVNLLAFVESLCLYKDKLCDLVGLRKLC